MDGGLESNGEFVVAGRQATKLFELIEKALDAVALAVARGVEGQPPAAGGQRRDHRLDPIQGQARANAIGIVAAVEHGGFEDVFFGQAFGERFELPAVVGLARAQVERDGAVFVEGRRVDLG